MPGDREWMPTRDELIKEAARAMLDAVDYSIDGRSMEIVDALLARWPHLAGPQQVTTAEELDALPHETVIRDHDGTVFEMWADDDGRDWMEPGWDQDRELKLPVVVLFHPDPKENQ
jgi:hypothetical protein